MVAPDFYDSVPIGTAVSLLIHFINNIARIWNDVVWQGVCSGVVWDNRFQMRNNMNINEKIFYTFVLTSILSTSALGSNVRQTNDSQSEYLKKERALLVLISSQKRSEVKRLLDKSREYGLSYVEYNYLKTLISNDLLKLMESPIPLISD